MQVDQTTENRFVTSELCFPSALTLIQVRLNRNTSTRFQVQLPNGDVVCPVSGIVAELGRLGPSGQKRTLRRKLHIEHVWNRNGEQQLS
ncbi:hypothetical protein OGAPHI_007459 [Ogataea philodendri]|uniref:Uncharacterized protein n=1 Tax=Ogataea philodendri TaxID=1378263 RepID=A0A9P8NWD1_9ASCO|nr:uncharacterized protein OGAPHI_007459 [Ogataea philodendri]KAH3660254.1 hypothetical protein OGAPHI_007459 [Ogataea philodendri]